MAHRISRSLDLISSKKRDFRQLATMNVDPAFEPLLSDYLPEVLLTSVDTIYGLTPDLKLAYFNQGWTQFALRNGGEPEISRDWSLGRRILDAIPTALRPYFVENFGRCIAQCSPWEHEYECSSLEINQRFVLRAYPLQRSQGILVVNSPVYAGAPLGEACAPVEANYRNSDGLIIQCCHCRRVRRIGARKAWDRVPEWVSKFPHDTSHGICEPCFGFYYGGKRQSRG